MQVCPKFQTNLLCHNKKQLAGEFHQKMKRMLFATIIMLMLIGSFAYSAQDLDEA